jgi:predicted nucleic acid-binding protein
LTLLIVSDTSPLRALPAIDQVQLVKALYGMALMPPAVAAELAADAPVVGRFPLERYPFLVVQAPQDTSRVELLLKELELGDVRSYRAGA